MEEVRPAISKRTGGKEKFVLLHDWHPAHNRVHYELSLLLKEDNIYLELVPITTTKEVQPNDLGVFSALDAEMEKELTKLREAGDKFISKNNLFAALLKAEEQLFKEK